MPKTRARKPKADLPKGEKAYELKSGVILSSQIESKVGRTADRYYAKAKSEITVPRGTRSAKAQAGAMYVKLAGASVGGRIPDLAGPLVLTI